jgi:hypothetical protein
MSSNTRGCNHIQLNIDVRKQICHKCPGSQGRPTAATQLSPLTAATHAPHIPGAMPVGIAVRDAGCPLARSPNGATPQSDHMARQLARIRVGRWVLGKRRIQLKVRVRSEKSTAPRWNGLHCGTRAAAVRCCRACFPCASPASSSSWAGLRSRLYDWRDNVLVSCL